ncbi:Cell-death-related_nuclease 7 [Hexamita inflata]|uniref:Cell-death-related_nuclease 7 n=1 Tax=Hexamita inflata TaxID=28002 RepID=A0ABP1GUB8_9EUKA
MISYIYSICTLSCLNKDGQAIDWYVQIKKNKGFEAIYFDQTTNDFEHVAPMTDLNLNPIMKTLNPIYQDDSLFYMLFNDKTSDDKQSSSLAHQKGVIAFDIVSQTGVYILHSTPGWPNRQNETFDFTADDYAQHFLCLSIDLPALQILGEDLYVTRPQIYYNSFNAEFLEQQVNYLFQASQNKYDKEKTTKRVDFFTRAGQKFSLTYKNSQASVDIWSQVALSHKENLRVETWLRENGNAKAQSYSYCGENTVELVGLVQFLNYTWKETSDHCKWGVGQTIACFADINFQVSQLNRGGSVMCIQNPALQAALSRAIVELDRDMLCCASNFYKNVPISEPYKHDYECLDTCLFPFIYDLNLTVHPTMFQCYSCQKFTTRHHTCVDSCSFINNTICEELGDRTNCPFVNGDQCVFTCENGSEPNDQRECIKINRGHMGFVIGISVTIGVVTIGVIIGVIVCCKRKQKYRKLGAKTGEITPFKYGQMRLSMSDM